MGKFETIAAVFGAASLLSFGGGTTIVPQLHLETVSRQHWLSDQQFADSFAITQVAPGPSTLLVTLLGYSADGLPGAAIATMAMIVPASILAWLVALLWCKSGHSRWHTAFEGGIAPIAVGLVASSGIIIAMEINHDVAGWVITAASAAILAVTRINPVFVIVAGGLTAWLLDGI